jgi:site-specific DNA-methyltransferase (adenine-specific)
VVLPRVNGTFNERIGTPNQMPEQLMGRIIRLSSNPGDTVLDPFAGSATTLVVAKKLGRGYLGCEQSTNFYKLALSRLDAAADGQPLAGRDHPELEPDKPVK